MKSGSMPLIILLFHLLLPRKLNRETTSLTYNFMTSAAILMVMYENKFGVAVILGFEPICDCCIYIYYVLTFVTSFT